MQGVGCPGYRNEKFALGITLVLKDFISGAFQSERTEHHFL
jgi:hypothetical protein